MLLSKSPLLLNLKSVRNYTPLTFEQGLRMAVAAKDVLNSKSFYELASTYQKGLEMPPYRSSNEIMEDLRKLYPEDIATYKFYQHMRNNSVMARDIKGGREHYSDRITLGKKIPPRNLDVIWDTGFMRYDFKPDRDEIISSPDCSFPYFFKVWKTDEQKRKQRELSVGKERSESLLRTKRPCKTGVFSDVPIDDYDMMTEEEQSILESQITSAVKELNLAVNFQGKDTVQKKVNALRELRRLLCKSEFPPVETAINSGAIPLLAQCLSFGSQDEQLLEAAWCLTNIAAGGLEEKRALLPALPLLIAHIGEKSSVPVAEQCAWALGNVAGEGEELRRILISQGALLPLAKMMLPNKGSTVRIAAWALSNLIKGPDTKAARELVEVDGVVEATLRHLRKSEDELATEVAWVVVYLSARSPVTTSVLVKTDTIQLLVERLASSNSLQLLIPVLWSLGNMIAGHGYTINAILIPGMKLQEATWVLSHLAQESVAHKQLIYNSEALPLLLELLVTAQSDIKKEVAFVLGNICVAVAEGSTLIVDHLESIVRRGCVGGFIDLVKSPDIEAARVGLQFLELVLRGMPNGEGQQIVKRENGTQAIERCLLRENLQLHIMATELLWKYFGEE